MSGSIEATPPVAVDQPSHDASEEQSTAPPRSQHQGMYFFSVTNWWSRLNKRSAFTVLILVYINLINYMDRSTVAGMITSIKNDPNFDLKNNDRYLGLLQTAFVICYMLFAPLFGYLGDRHSRKWLLAAGVSFWSVATFVGSFMESFWGFLFFRALVGIGEASYSTVAPAIISDLYQKDLRSKVLALFYFAIPVGTGMGYMLGAGVADAAGDWRWGLRVTPFMGIAAVLLIVCFMMDPPRGLSEGAHLRPTSPKEDLKELANNRSYVLSTAAFTCVTFCAGALMWWGPNFAYLGAKAECGNKAGCELISESSVGYNFGIVMMFAGLLGVPAGSYIAQAIRRHVPNADPIVSGTSLLLSVPVLYAGFIVARHSVNACYGLTFLAGLLLNCNWAIVGDMTLYIVIPTRRSLASATQILVSHALGDAFSPYLIGLIADWIRPIITPENQKDMLSSAANSTQTYLFRASGIHIEDGPSPISPENYDIEFRCLQYALFLCCFFQAFGALFFFYMSFHVLKDKAKADRAIANAEGNEDTRPIVEGDGGESGADAPDGGGE